MARACSSSRLACLAALLLLGVTAASAQCPPIPSPTPPPVCNITDLTCPIPQPPESVINVLAGGSSFVWTALAAVSPPPSKAAARVKTARPGRAAPAAKKATKEAAPAAAGVGTAAVEPKAEPGVIKPKLVLNQGFQIGLGTISNPPTNGYLGTYDPTAYPSDEAIAVGPSGTTGQVYVLHAVNEAAEIHLVDEATGALAAAQPTPTRVRLSQIMAATGLVSVANLVAVNPSAYFDLSDNVWVLTFTSSVNSLLADAQPLLFVAVSQTSDPLGTWAVKALFPKPPWPYRCNTGPLPNPLGTVEPKAQFETFVADYPQITYTADAVYITLGGFCQGVFESLLWAYPKTALYSPTSTQVVGAVWLLAKAWTRSIPPTQNGGLPASINNYAQPARPQQAADVTNRGLFVMKIDDARMGVATVVTRPELPIANMTNPDTAPWLLANVVDRMMNFSNGALPEGVPGMPQPDTTWLLSSGDTGLALRSNAVRSYGATQTSNGAAGSTLLTLTTSEYYTNVNGPTPVRVPSIFYMNLQITNADLCSSGVLRLASGVIASADGTPATGQLAFAFPTVAIKADNNALIAYSYSGGSTITSAPVGNALPAYAGAAVTTVSSTSPAPGGVIDVVKVGEAAITYTADTADALGILRFGDYSASQVYNGKMYYAVPISILVPGDGTAVTDGRYGSWVGNAAL